MTKTISILFLASAALHVAVLGLIRFDSSSSINAGSPFRVSIQATSHTPDRHKPVTDLAEARASEKNSTLNKTTVSTVKTDIETTSTKALTPEKSEYRISLSDQQETVEVVLESAQPEEVNISSASTVKHDVSETEKSLSLSPKTASLLRVDLQRAFALNFSYPRLAIKRGWQGEVQLGLRINAKGYLSQIRILQGSGYDILDKAAIKSLNKVEILPEAIAFLNGHSLDLILPVSYQLL